MSSSISPPYQPIGVSTRANDLFQTDKHYAPSPPFRQHPVYFLPEYTWIGPHETISTVISSHYGSNAYMLALFDLERYRRDIERLDLEDSSVTQAFIRLKEEGKYPRARVAIVDPGDCIIPFNALIEALDATVDHILITHEHLDHLIGTKGILQHIYDRAQRKQIEYMPPTVRVGGPTAAARIQKPEKVSGPEVIYDTPMWDSLGVLQPPVKIVGDREEFSLRHGKNAIRFVAHRTPGHTKDSVLYEFWSTDNYHGLFTGDTVFAGKEERFNHGGTKWPESDQALMRTSVKGLLNRFDDTTNIFPGHGVDTNMQRERRPISSYLNYLDTKEKGCEHSH